ncbi:hypothetical protein [Streptomyces hygroscopicus]|uniref:hypothetical protein n=1 Tax=Streptomyces hygroscopicus TaxID=1912 RepID=UPI00131D028E|nr:hypothetical protein [Streptomyces hygroscopicus]
MRRRLPRGGVGGTVPAVMNSVTVAFVRHPAAARPRPRPRSYGGVAVSFVQRPL